MVDAGPVQLRLFIEEAGQVCDVGDQVPWVAGVEGNVMPAIPVLKQVLVDVWFEFKPVHLTDAFEDLPEFGFCGMFNLYLVADAAQEGFVNQALGVEVGGENNQLVEGDFELRG